MARKKTKGEKALSQLGGTAIGLAGLGVGTAVAATTAHRAIAQAPAAQPALHAQQRVYTWGGGFHVLPESFRLPKCALPVMFQHWICGSEAGGYPPLRSVTSIDVQQCSPASPNSI